MQEEAGTTLFFQRRLARLQSLLEAPRRIHGTVDPAETPLDLAAEGAHLRCAEGYSPPRPGLEGSS